MLFRVVRAGRWLAGRPPETVTCSRQGVRWHLDLREGIQLAIYLSGTFERRTTRALQRLLPTGGVAIDIGANIGAHALPMARRVGSSGRVIAIEPTVGACAALRRNLELNPDLFPVVRVHQAAIVAEGGSSPPELYSSWPLARFGDVHAVHRGERQSTRGATALTLDDLVARESPLRVDVIKIDVDGGEVKALTGARRTLRERRPVLVLELCPYALQEHGDSLAALVSLLADEQYQLLAEQTFRPITSDAIALERTIPRGGSINIVAAPRERALERQSWA